MDGSAWNAISGKHGILSSSLSLSLSLSFKCILSHDMRDGNCLRCYVLIFTTYWNNERRVRSQVNDVNEVNEDAVTELDARQNDF